MEEALDTARALGASYADARWVELRREEIRIRNLETEELRREERRGVGIRVLCEGAWGFAAAADPSPREASEAAELAVRLARAAARIRARKVDLGEPVRSRGSYKTPFGRDPFSVSVEEKIELLLQALSEMRKEKEMKAAEGWIRSEKEHKIFASTEGSWVDQELVRCGASIRAWAVREDEVQVRSYPSSLGHMESGGWEVVERLDLVGNARRIAWEAAALLSAPLCPDLVTTVILDGAQLALQIHESLGHPAELDRVLGTEASYAGTSFLTPEKRGSFRYGSEEVTLVADATAPGGLGSFGWDDEGVPAQRIVLVDRGIFRNYLSSRETAAILGMRSGGAMRASGFDRMPLVRMTNVNLEPGEWKFEDLISDTEEGIYLANTRSWSIDDRRLNFHFEVEIAWEIKGGKLGRILKNAAYTGVTPEFWSRCDAVCSREHWRMWGVLDCAKGEPVQLVGVGHGTAPARFRGVRVLPGR